MRRVLRPFLALTAFAAATAGPAALHAQKSFEGEVTMSISMPAMGQNLEMTYLVKGSKMRNEMAMMGMQTVSIVDMDAGTMMTIMPMQKAYMKMDMKQMAEQLGGEQPPPKITATGKTETIVGRECEYHTIEQAGQSMEVCVAEGMGYFNANAGRGGMGGGMGLGAHEEIWQEAFKDGYFPLKMIVNSQGMGMEMTVTKIEEKSVPDSAFEMTVPEGYTQMQMPGMGGRGGG